MPKRLARVATKTGFRFAKGERKPSVPTGRRYKAILDRLETTTSKPEYGGKEQLVAIFQISGGKYEGRELRRYANLTNDSGDRIQPTFESDDKSGIGKLILELWGGRPDGDEVDLEERCGLEYQLVVTAAESGYPKIAAILPAESDEESGQVDEEDPEPPPQPAKKQSGRTKKARQGSAAEPDDGGDEVPWG
ncbi:MAG: hypothetical protein CMJ50_00190 [Planctomycetaceae bacterium]|nr:hypothetical protein [Planctomycetaceae bacterium]